MRWRFRVTVLVVLAVPNVVGADQKELSARTQSENWAAIGWSKDAQRFGFAARKQDAYELRIFEVGGAAPIWSEQSASVAAGLPELRRRGIKPAETPLHSEVWLTSIGAEPVWLGETQLDSGIGIWLERSKGGKELVQVKPGYGIIAQWKGFFLSPDRRNAALLFELNDQRRDAPKAYNVYVVSLTTGLKLPKDISWQRLIRIGAGFESAEPLFDSNPMLHYCNYDDPSGESDGCRGVLLDCSSRQEQAQGLKQWLAPFVRGENYFPLGCNRQGESISCGSGAGDLSIGSYWEFERGEGGWRVVGQSRLMSTMTAPPRLGRMTEQVKKLGCPTPERSFHVARVRPKDFLKLRSKPSTQADAIANLPNDSSGIRYAGEQVVVGETPWWKVQVPGGKVGWVNLMYLEPSP